MTPPARPRVAIVGAGRVGTALALRLARAGYPVVGIASRRLPSARRAARLAPGAVATRSPGQAAGKARLVLIAVPDREVTGVATALARARSWNGRVVLHTCGSLGPEVLRPLRSAGAATGTFHPLQTFPPAGEPPPALRGVRAAIDGDAAAVALAGKLARDLRMVCLTLSPERRGEYHLAAAMASNHLVALLDAAVGILSRAGPSREEALGALLPLVRGTVEGLQRTGLPRALTGPVARGDGQTVARHLRVLEPLDPALGQLYRNLSLRALRLASEAGLEDDAVRRLRRRLQQSREGRGRRGE